MWFEYLDSDGKKKQTKRAFDNYHGSPITKCADLFVGLSAGDKTDHGIVNFKTWTATFSD